MNEPTLIRMANQIADFFQPYSEDEAVDGIAGHIRSFWEPRMREGLLAVLDTNPDALKPVVAAALRKLAEPAD